MCVIPIHSPLGDRKLWPPLSVKYPQNTYLNVTEFKKEVTNSEKGTLVQASKEETLTLT